MRVFKINLLIITVTLFLLMSSCSEKMMEVDLSKIYRPIPNLQNDVTTKQELLQELGKPMDSYDDGLIIIYFVVDRGDGNFEIMSADHLTHSQIVSQYQLILVFDSTFVLKRHSLVGAN